MLLPSDVARLVLGYLQQEKLSVTCQSFIAESPCLKEYAEHYSDEGSIPGCVLSLFGKNLTTILNEYMAMKAQENKEEIPLMVSALWKKLDHTLSQIRSMHNCLFLPISQKARTRTGIEDLRRRRKLTSHLSSAQPAVTQQTSTPIAGKQVVLKSLTAHSASQAIASPLFSGPSAIQCYSSPASESRGESLQTSTLVTAERKQTSAVSSPMRRKLDCQKRRRTTLQNTSSASLEGETGGNIDSIQELIDGNFPQLVIENAREKILSNKSLQQKLAENINKFLGRPSDGGTLEHDASSIDEILGLQAGEIHMSEEAIQDILEQTELDPDFQELYDLFASGSSKTTKSMCRESLLQTESALSGNSNEPTEDNLEPMESSVETDVNAASQTRNLIEDITESNTAQHAVPSTLMKSADSVKTSPKIHTQPLCGTEGASATHLSLTSKRDLQNMDSIINLDETGSDTVVEVNENVKEVKPASSLPEDVEMNNISHGEEGNDGSCHVSKAPSPSNVFVNETSISDVHKARDINCEKSPQEKLCQNSLTLINKDPSDIVQMETNQSDLSDQQNMSAVVVPVSLGSPVVTKASPLKEKDKQEITSKQKHLEAPIDVGGNELFQQDDSKALCDELKDQEKSVCAGQTLHQPEVDENEPMQGSSLGSGQIVLPSENTTSVVQSAPSSNTKLSTDDPSQIITLSFITADLAEDPELTNAITSISNKNSPVVTRSPLQTSQGSNSTGTNQGSSADEIAGVPLLEDQREVIAVSSDLCNEVNIPAEECTIISVAGTTNLSSDGGIIQLMPATNSSFAPSGSFFISSCVPNASATQQSNIVMVPTNINQKQPCHFQTPPRPRNLYSVGQAISPKLSQGSTFIVTSAVQPVLPGMVSMFPLSVVGQSNNAFTAPAHQVLHVPVSQGVAKLPLPPKSHKLAPSRNLPNPAPANESVKHTAVSRMQRSENAVKNTVSSSQNKPDEKLTGSSHTNKVPENYKRVLCFDNSTTKTVVNSKPLDNPTVPQNRDKKETLLPSGSITGPSSSKQSNNDLQKPEVKFPTTEESSKSDAGSVKPITKDQTGDQKLVGMTSSPNVLSGVTSNKENLLQKESKKQDLPDLRKKAANSGNVAGNSPSRVNESGKKQNSPSILRKTQTYPIERVFPTSPLTKQASDLLQGIQFNSPNRKHFSGGDLPIPRTPGSGIYDRSEDEHQGQMKTPNSKRHKEDGTNPKPMLPPATPELLACSPASETGSENSVNMAAHTLMILSRATIAKTDSNTPLKDNILQLKSSKSTSKKRKIDEPEEYERRPHKKELQSTSAILKRKKMKKQQKKTLDSFPAGMDVEKFLMSLHYDE
ncbi:hypothetical protein GDO86_004665 [Hymenochirus boettgeri]|uniref:Protein NPAT C-terminal domain-containing protein n=1 Tax=Hymenochirus boettgeri TaxID=247094 RepID=A0A8T2KF00_9PIPI|nr:hypothetical protein GDO86_004665 [Hymenochirus boettgeri]